MEHKAIKIMKITIIIRAFLSLVSVSYMKFEFGTYLANLSFQPYMKP